MRILAIETSCDETGITLLEASGGLRTPKFKIIKNLVSSQIKVHAPFGGVVPNLAKREHLKNLPVLLKKLSPKSSALNPDLITVTVGPGLEPALWAGVNFAKETHQQLTIKNKQSTAELIGVNHLEGHLYSFLLARGSSIKGQALNVFPAIHLLVSGGHTILVLMKSMTDWEKLGETRDDAAGEAFDKVARMLGLPYPGGPELEKLSGHGNPTSIDFPRPMINSKNYDFSFSGLKTSVLYYLRDHKRIKKANVAAAFQRAAIETLVSKTMRAAEEFGVKSVMLSGGVASNNALRRELRVKCKKLNVKFLVSPKKFNTDNATIIAVAGYIQYLKKKKRFIRAQANLNL